MRASSLYFEEEEEENPSCPSREKPIHLMVTFGCVMCNVFVVVILCLQIIFFYWKKFSETKDLV